MFKKIVKNKGFTLIELMVAITIFGIFIGLFVNTYLFLSSAIRDTNTNRKVYVEARNLLEQMSQEMRKKTVDYGYYPSGKIGLDGLTPILVLSSKKDGERTSFQKVGTQIQMKKEKWNEKIGNGEWEAAEGFLNGGRDLLGENIKVKSLIFGINPVKAPASSIENGEIPYHPRVTIFLSLEGRKASFDVQKTISTRVYE